MKQQTKIIIIVLVVVAVIALIAYARKKRQQANNPTLIPTQNSGINLTLNTAKIPAAVLKEPVADWIGEILTYQGVKYTPVNGIWTIVK